MKGAEPHTMLAQHGALILAERLDLAGDLFARHDAKRLDDLESNAAGNAGDLFCFAQ